MEGKDVRDEHLNKEQPRIYRRGVKQIEVKSERERERERTI